jgi:hypothetical protein
MPDKEKEDYKALKERLRLMQEAKKKEIKEEKEPEDEEEAEELEEEKEVSEIEPKEQKVVYLPRAVSIEELLNNISDKLDYLISK